VEVITITTFGRAFHRDSDIAGAFKLAGKLGT
jgi:hypothetical protein